MTTSPWALLAQMPDVELQWTSDQAVLKGRRARWFPRPRIIVMDKALKRRTARCSLAHEIAHVVLEHPAACDNRFFDQRRELEADRFAARFLLPDLAEVARELATASTYGHAAANLHVTLDMLEARLADLAPREHRLVSDLVCGVHEGIGA